VTAWALKRTYSFRGQAVHYDVLGEGPAIVLAHGTPFSSYIWHRIAPYLAERHQVFLFDLLGYGQSEKRDGQDVSLGVQNEVLTELLAHWQLDRPDVVGHDFGGTSALRAHLLNGRDFHSLTLIDPVVLSPWDTGFDQHVRQHESAFRDVPAEIHQAILSAYVRVAFARAPSDDELAPYLQPWQGVDGQRAFYRQIVQYDERYTDEVQSRLAEIRCPTLVLWGEEDRWLPIEQGRRLSSLIPSAKFKSFPGSGHLMPIDAPEAVISGVDGFLDGIAP